MMIDPRIDKAREYLAGIYSPSSAVISDLLAVIAERDAEVERLRSYRSLPDGYVWQDYYSPDDVIKIRESLEAERDDAIASANDWADNYATAAAERDEARAAIREARTIRTVEQMAELPEEPPSRSSTTAPANLSETRSTTSAQRACHPDLMRVD